MVHLGPVWRDVLLSAGAFGWLVELAGVLHGQSGKGKGPLATATRHLVVQLCSVTGAVFGKDEQGELRAQGRRESVPVLDAGIPEVRSKGTRTNVMR
jgi:hypothetical protein